jgi:hypothetical protein
MKFWYIIGLKYSKFRSEFMKLSDKNKGKFVKTYYNKLGKLYNKLCPYICENIYIKDHCVYIIEELGKKGYDSSLKRGKIDNKKLKKSRFPKSIIFYSY